MPFLRTFFGKVTTSASLTTSSEQSPFFATAVLNWEAPLFPWRSVNKTSEQWIRYDLGASPPAVFGLYVRGANFASATIQANSTDTWTSPPVSVAISLATTPFLGRRQGMFFFNTARTSITYRYLRIHIAANLATDGNASYYQIGVALPVIQSLELDPRPHIERTYIDPIIEHAWIGRREVSGFGLARRQVVLSLPWEFFVNYLATSPNEENDVLFLSTLPDEPILVCPNLDRLAETYLTRRVGELKLSMNGGAGASVPLAFEEVM